MGITGTVQGAEVTAAEILERAAMTQSSQHRVLDAVLRTDDQKIPFRLVLNGPEIRYEFSNPEQVFVVKLGPKARIQEVTPDKASRIPAAKYDAAVRNSDVTYEDLALRFLYWKDAKLVSEEGLAAGRSYKLEMHPGDIPSQYGTVRAWINEKSGGLDKAECYNRKGQLVARFSVRSIRKLSDGTWIFKSMRIERMDDGKSRDSEPTYLEISGEEGAR
jgi:hypothetical protein